MPKAMREIVVLPPGVVNKIAAGEVIERPASVVKELMENAVDAGASRIDVSIEKGGAELIRVTDNGRGIRGDQLKLAVASHATSKITSADDLFAVTSLGFRGEALASIAEVSHFTLRSRIQISDVGFELEVVGGEASDVSPCGSPIGTTVEVRNLFFNTPVRRRYLKTPQTESGHITEAFTRIALANPEIRFRLIHNTKTLHDLPPADNWKERIGHFFGQEIRDALIPVSNTENGMELSGFVVDPMHSRSHNRMQYLFLNGRHIRDRSLQHALGEAYRGLLLHGRFPISFLRLSLPPDQVDVNVHPGKLEVRFEDGGKVYSHLLGTLRNKFLTTDLTARMDEGRGPERSSDAAGIPVGLESHKREFRRWAETQSGRGAESGDTGMPAPGQRELVMSTSRPSAVGIGPAAVDRYDDDRPTSGFAPGDTAALDDLPPAEQFRRTEAAGDSQRRPAAIQIQNRYLVAESAQGMVVVDQHALHERILYEQLREKVLRGQGERQRLLVPETVHLSPAEAAAAMDARELLEQIGLEIESMGGQSIVIHAYPAMLGRQSPAEVLRQMVEQLLVEGKKPDRRDVLDELLHMISCKAAVKAGDPLSGEEITILLENLEMCQDSHHCPHGRPTALVFSRDELDRRFKRI